MCENIKKWMIDEGVNEIGRIVNDSSYMFYYSPEKQRQIKFTAIKKAFEFHFANNKFYNDFCKNNSGITPSEITQYDDIHSIPLIPISYFEQGKSESMMTVPYKFKQLEFHTSGIGGQHTVAFRDSISNEHATVGLSQMFMELFDMRFEASPAVVYFTPSILEAPNLGMLRALSILGSTYAGCMHAVEKNEFKFREVYDYINSLGMNIPVYLVAPPFILNFFLEYLVANSLKLSLNSGARIITMGGWKRHTGKVILKEDFIRKCENIIGVSPSQIRDTYGSIVLNQLSIECASHSMHVPPFAEMYTRNLNDNSIICKDGELGVLSVLDPTLVTYPGFILTEDVACLKHDYNCLCGRTSTVVEIIGKVPKADANNCSITLDQYLTGVTNKINYGEK